MKRKSSQGFSQYYMQSFLIKFNSRFHSFFHMVNSSYDIYIITFENFSLVLSQELQPFDFNPRISQLLSHGKNWYHLFATNFTGCFTGISWSLKFHIFFHRAKKIHFFAQGYNSEFTAYFTWQKYFTWVSQGFHMHFTGLLPVVNAVLDKRVTHAFAEIA